MSTSSRIKSNSTMVKRRIKKSSLKPPTAARKVRTKTKKPKFLSLKLQLSPENTQQKMPTSPPTNHPQQLKLFPLHPENSTEEKEGAAGHDDHPNMAYFFSAADGGATSLTGLLGSSRASSSNDETNSCAALSPSVSLNYAYGAQDSELVRTALRNKERDASEERWVYYSEVVEKRSDDQEVTSSAVDHRRKLQRLALKLDYQEILNAWSDRSPLYFHAESPQTVPDINDHFLFHQSPNGLQDSWGNNAKQGTWIVPEMTKYDTNGGIPVKQEECEEWKLGQREASVLRYKEKRQNRLFSKRIRYEVRKLNAEKRPRVKGRFVKRS